MADKKLSSVSEVSDVNYVYAETSSGETVKISKADLATVVAGFLNYPPVVENSIAVSIGTPITIEGLGIYRCYLLTVVYEYTRESSVFILGTKGIISTIKDELGDRLTTSYNDGVITFENISYGTYNIHYTVTEI